MPFNTSCWQLTHVNCLSFEKALIWLNWRHVKFTMHTYREIVCLRANEEESNVRAQMNALVARDQVLSLSHMSSFTSIARIRLSAHTHTHTHTFLNGFCVPPSVKLTHIHTYACIHTERHSYIHSARDVHCQSVYIRAHSHAAVSIVVNTTISMVDVETFDIVVHTIFSSSSSSSCSTSSHLLICACARSCVSLSPSVDACVRACERVWVNEVYCICMWYDTNWIAQTKYTYICIYLYVYIYLHTYSRDTDSSDWMWIERKKQREIYQKKLIYFFCFLFRFYFLLYIPYH